MIAILDTSSLLAFVRYYLPFDKRGTFKSLIHSKFESEEIIILDKVFDEAKYISHGIILEELEFMNDKSKHINTISLIPSIKFFNIL